MNQHLADITIPVIEIAEGWAAEDCKTISDCDDAYAYLMAAIASIELQVELELLLPFPEQRGQWIAKARCALKYKRAALQIVANRRSAINTEAKTARLQAEDTRLVQHLKGSLSPDQWAALMASYEREAA